MTPNRRPVKRPPVPDDQLGRDMAAVEAAYPHAAVYMRGARADGNARYAAVRRWPAYGERPAFIGCWCKSGEAAWASAARCW